ncbi:MAG: YbaK/EbsC family protein [Candidatus Kuenenbacteria bacterium]
MLSKKLFKLLEENKTKYEIIGHKTVYTAYDVAATMKIKLNLIAKSLLIKFNKPFITGEKPYAIAIVPADKNIDLKRLVKVVSAHAVELNKKLRLQKPVAGKKPLVDIYNKVSKVSIPKEGDMKTKFKVKRGSMAAFGSIYKLPVFIDRALKGTAVFSSGSFMESIKMKVGDFVKMENCMSGNFSAAKKLKKSKVKTKKKIK